MKKYIIVFAMLSLVCSCNHENVIGYVDLSKYQGSSEESVFQMTKVIQDDLCEEVPYYPLPYDETEESEETKATYTSAIAFIRELLGNGYHANLTSIVGTYYSIDENGDKIKLSGKIVYPTKGEIKNIIVTSHFTVGSNAECPSECFQLEAMLATLGYAMIFPDYLGFGVSKGKVHPYLVANLTAINIVDMLRAAKPYLKETLEKQDRSINSDEIYLMGYSQGGANTISTLRYMENECGDEFKIRRAIAGGGPYDIAATYDALIAADKSEIPYCVPMVIQGMDVGNHLNLERYNYFFKDKEARIKLFDLLNGKNHTLKQISNLMGTDKLSDILTEEGRTKRAEGTRELYRAMKENSVNMQWAPKTPVYMFHSQDDMTVPFVNAQIAKEYFKDSNVDYNFGHYGSHQKGAIRFILSVKTLLEEEQD